jgi:transposase-like protein
MTLVPLAEAAHRLGIDLKTLHRWLAQAQLSLHSHPGDGRKKGVSSEHLHLLAHLHQRSLTPFPAEPSAPGPNEMPALSALVLALPEQLSALQTQLAALQQQVSDLTRLLEYRQPEPTLSAAPTPLNRSNKRSRQPVAPRARATSAAAKPPRQPVHVIPRVEYSPEGRYVVICPKQGVLPFEPETPEWFAWVAQQSSFRFVGQGGALHGPSLVARPARGLAGASASPQPQLRPAAGPQPRTDPGRVRAGGSGTASSPERVTGVFGDRGGLISSSIPTSATVVL